MVWLIVTIVLLVLVIIGLIIKIFLMRKSATEIITKLASILNSQTNIVIDISSRDKKIKQLTSNINLELLKLQKLRNNYLFGDRELKEAIANISHDLRTPLTAIIGYINLLDEIEKSDKATEYLKIIKERADTLKTLTEELFKYSIIVSYKDNNDLETVNVNSILQESIIGYYSMFKERNIEPVVTICDKLVEKIVNKNALKSILDNIMSNAIKYSDGDFEVELKEDGVIVFANTSLSLSKISIEKLFDRYFTVDSAERSTGLGLAITKILTEQIKGTLNAEYIADKFIITLSI